MIRPPLSYPNELLQFAFFPCKTNYVRMLITAWQSRVLSCLEIQEHQTCYSYCLKRRNEFFLKRVLYHVVSLTKT